MPLVGEGPQDLPVYRKCSSHTQEDQLGQPGVGLAVCDHKHSDLSAALTFAPGCRLLFPISSLFLASNVSHTVVLRPLKAGYFNFTSATITYLAQEGAQVVVGFTSAPGQGGILAQRDFDRRFSPHFLDWAAFGVMTLPSIGIPLLLWYSSKRKYDTPKTKKN
uniref:Translocon-associated protein subunit beta n=1 Tax=Malurus cyaneus samueli TaxID=2593467 RepID=A0A8C5TTZ8_9PASS